MNIEIQPKGSLCDEKFNVIISSLRPNEEIKISASMHLPWAPKIQFESFASFIADPEGIIDLSKQKPVSGTYDYVDSMGIINSLKKPKDCKIDGISKNISIENSLVINLTFESNNKSESIKIDRPFKSPGIKTFKINEKLIGNFFYSDNNKQKTIIALGGSDGNLEALSPIASLLASRGFNVLTVSYFNQKGLPKKLERVPLEYFENIFTWLQSFTVTKNNEIFLWGGSIGGELALLLASKYPFIKKVVAANPHAYCFQGVSFKNVSSWTYQGQDLPFIHLNNRVLLANMISCIIHNKPFGFTHTYRKGIEEATNKETARIKIENSNADILLFAGKQDNIWNSHIGCALIMEKLKASNYKNSYYYVEYEDAGQPVYAPYIIPLDAVSEVKLFPRFTLSAGGNLEANAKAQADMWQKTLEFFNN